MVMLEIFRDPGVFSKSHGNLQKRLRLSVKRTLRVIDAKYLIKPVVYGDFWRPFCKNGPKSIQKALRL